MLLRRTHCAALRCAGLCCSHRSSIPTSCPRTKLVPPFTAPPQPPIPSPSHPHPRCLYDANWLCPRRTHVLDSLPTFRRCRSCCPCAPTAVVFPLLLAHTAAAGGSRTIVDFAHFCKIFDECISNTHVRLLLGCALLGAGAGQRAGRRGAQGGAALACELALRSANVPALT